MDYVRLEQGIRHRLWVTDLPLQLQGEFSQLVVKWVRCSGKEWAVKRLKSLKVDLFRAKAGLPPLTWVRKNSSGEIAGTVGAIFRWSLRSERNFRKGVQSLMAYSWFYHEKVSATQMKKFINAVGSKEVSLQTSLLSSISRMIKGEFRKRTVDRSEDIRLLTTSGSPTKRKPVYPSGTLPQGQSMLNDSQVITHTLYGPSLYKVFQDLYDPVLSGINLVWPFRSPRMAPNNLDHIEVFGGKIGFIQEAGLKLRCVASTYLVHQLALKHFGKSIYKFVSTLPWDCTYDQSKPVSVLQERLRKGKVIHSVDLSSATDLFPLRFQALCLRSLYGDISDITLFETISQSNWYMPDKSTINWTKGQPLGLYPSFGVFTASHGLLLKYLSGSYDVNHPKFFVLGDDVVILDDDLFEKYMTVLRDWECEYSPEKSLSSSEICEFAGKVITTNSVTSQLKWREPSNDSFLDICRLLGPRSRTLLTERQKRVFDIVKNLSLPLGLNYSYPGSNLVEMEEKSRFLFGKLEPKVLESLMDLYPVMSRNYYESITGNRSSYPVLVNQHEAEKTLLTFDEKVKTVLSNLLSWFSNQDTRGFSTVPRALENFDLPLRSNPISRITTLDRYEALLN